MYIYLCSVPCILYAGCSMMYDVCVCVYIYTHMYVPHTCAQNCSSRSLVVHLYTYMMNFNLHTCRLFVVYFLVKESVPVVHVCQLRYLITYICYF